jgi:hypothetical protein
VATSGSYDYSRTAAQVITSAYENLGVIAAGGTVASADETTALARLNFIAKQHDGPSAGVNLQVHSRQRVTLVLAKGQHSYLIGPASSDARSSTALGRTTLSAAEASSQTTISITSNTDTTSYPGTTITMTNGDIVGIELDDGTIHWSTISGTPASTMDIASGITGAAAAGNKVYWFTARAQRMVHVESALLRDENLVDTPLTVYTDARQYDQGVSDKYSDGSPSAILVEPLRIATRVTLDSQPTDVTETVVLTGWYPQEDYDATSNDIAFPQEAFRWLAWELSFELAPAFGVNWTDAMQMNRLEARLAFFNLNPDNSVLYFRGDGV